VDEQGDGHCHCRHYHGVDDSENLREGQLRKK
jgi:hypothetical protein